jgi:hypothetical protein
MLSMISCDEAIWNFKYLVLEVCQALVLNGFKKNLGKRCCQENLLQGNFLAGQIFLHGLISFALLSKSMETFKFVTMSFKCWLCLFLQAWFGSVCAKARFC